MLVMVITILSIVLLLVSVPISATLLAVSLAPSLLDPNFCMSTEYIIRVMLRGAGSFPLLVIPMFVLSGILMAKDGVSKKLFDALSHLLGEHIVGMPCTVIVTCLSYGAISDSVPAMMVAVGSITIPLLIRMGYGKVFMTTIIAVTDGLGVIIPPNIPFILFGMTSGTGVGKMFMAGIIPGALITLLLILYALYYYKKHGENKEKIHAEVSVLHKKGFVKVFLGNFWVLLTPMIILSCIYSGTASPTEAAVIFVFYALIISMYTYRTLKFRDLEDVLVEAICTFAPILLILSAAVAFSRIITLLQIPEMIGDFTPSTLSGKAAVLLVINVLLLIVGMVMDAPPAILILTPILILITNSLGIDLIQFGIVMVVDLATSFVAPSIDINLFVASSSTDAPVTQVTKEAVPLIAFFLTALLAITFILQISLPLAS